MNENINKKLIVVSKEKESNIQGVVESAMNKLTKIESITYHFLGMYNSTISPASFCIFDL